jgi:ABC-type Fe3+/spermidine/putrescine transport system ATPase subunit
MLEVRDIWKKYAGEPLLNGVSFDVQPGETVCLLGASGSGKSTLLRIITGLESAEKGSVLWLGQDISAVPVHRRGFGLMFQEYALFPHKTVAENVAFGLRMQGIGRAEITARVREALDLVNMSSFGQRRVTDLSGGEQQRVALARALAPRPRLLMLDEPLGALDRSLKEEVAEEIRQLLHATEIPAIYVTHDQEEAFAIADRLILLNRGKVEQSGTPAGVYSRPGSAWVAHFLGLSNLLPGKVTGLDPLQAQTGLGAFQGVWEAPGRPQVGEDITLLLRPAAVKTVVDPAGPQDRQDQPRLNCLRGVVVDSIFRGTGFRVILNSAGGKQFSFLLEDPQEKGKEINLAIHPEGVQFLKEQHG